MATALYNPNPVGPTISDETVALVRQAMADTTRAITTATGLIGYELETPAMASKRRQFTGAGRRRTPTGLHCLVALCGTSVNLRTVVLSHSSMLVRSVTCIRK